jgi:hypothetical protein
VTTYRDVCGSLRGMIAHQSAGERPCGWCAQAENATRLAAEAVTWPSFSGMPSPSSAPLKPVSAEEAAFHLASLAAEVDAYEASHPGGASHGRYRHLTPVRPDSGARKSA